MNDLPPELWTIIFKLLNLIDQNKCRLVSARWKNIVDSIKVRDLLISHSTGDLVNSWFISNKSFSLKNRLLLNLKSSTSFQSPSRFYGSLRRLRLNTEISLDLIKLRWLEKFDQLEQLEIDYIHSFVNFLISLPNLNKLYIGSMSEHNSFGTDFLTFNAPKLQFAYFGYDVLRAVRLIHFDCLQHLEIENDGGYSDLNHFKNLRIVHCHRIMKISLNLMKSLIRLPKLAELHCNSTGLSNYKGQRTPTDGEIERLGILFNYFSEQINELRELNLKLYLEGVLIKDGKEFDDYDFTQDVLKLHLENYDSLADCFPWYQEIAYTELIKSTSELPTNINQKYPNITSVRVDGTVEEEKFIWFLRGCRNLVALHIKVPLTQRFYDQLVDWNCGLRYLTIGHHNDEINFDFLYKLEYLVYFDTETALSMDIAQDIIRKLKYCKSLIFNSFSGNPCYIKKVGENNFKTYMSCDSERAEQ